MLGSRLRPPRLTLRQLFIREFHLDYATVNVQDDDVSVFQQPHRPACHSLRRNVSNHQPLHASVPHKGRYDSIPAAYGLLFTWPAQQGIAPTGPPVEVYLSDPTEVSEGRLVTEVRVLIT